MYRIECIECILVLLNLSLTIIEERKNERYRACNLIEHGNRSEDRLLCSVVTGSV